MKYVISPSKSWTLPCYAESLAAVDVEMASFSASEEDGYNPHVLQFLDVEAIETSMDNDLSESSMDMSSSY